MKRKKDNHNKGSLTVETLLFLIPFMCAFLLIINAARYIETEMIIHHAITQTAKQISTYSYVLTKTNVVSRIQKTNKEGATFKKDVNTIASDIGTFAENVDKLKGVETGGDLQGALEGMYDSGNSIYQTGSQYVKNPNKIATGIISCAKGAIEGKITSEAIAGLAKNSTISILESYSNDVDKYLERLGVVNGKSGLDFSDSEWINAADGKGNVDIVVKYTIKNQLFPDIADIGEHECCQRVSTLVW